ncbi:MAG: FtsB family cell division protein [Myxococcaceae bacterium]
MTSRRKVLWGAVVLAFLLAAASAVNAGGFRRYVSLRQELASLGERNRAAVEENRALRREIEALRSDPRALERAAREELGFVKPGEVVLIVE